MPKSFIVSLAALACGLGSSAANAASIEVTVSEPGKSGISQVVASWMQDQNPTPDDYSTNYFTTVPVWDATGLGGDTEVTWYSESHNGGFTNFSEEFNVLAPVSYAFTESSPTFVLGTYYGVDIKPDYNYLTATYTIAAVSTPQFKSALVHLIPFAAPPAAVPEPATWAMMLAGFGMIGLVARRQQKFAVTYG